MMWDHEHLLDRIRAYTMTERDQTLATARELERIAAELQQIADELRRLT
jgi:hypothetical protein